MRGDHDSGIAREVKSTIINKIVAIYPIGTLALFTYFLSMLYGSGLKGARIIIGKVAFYRGAISFLVSIIAYVHYRGWRGWICLVMGLTGILAIL